MAVVKVKARDLRAVALKEEVVEVMFWLSKNIIGKLYFQIILGSMLLHVAVGTSHQSALS